MCVLCLSVYPVLLGAYICICAAGEVGHQVLSQLPHQHSVFLPPATPVSDHRCALVTFQAA